MRRVGEYTLIRSGKNHLRVRLNDEALEAIGNPTEITAMISGSDFLVVPRQDVEAIVASTRKPMVWIGDRRVIYSGGKPYVSVPPTVAVSMGAERGSSIALYTDRIGGQLCLRLRRA